ncbi:MAG: hypothetical protein M3P06_00090 [Acidobacteriota bacterium]|nr:hypothetical protein [Acidobacteriota bacterium]
MSNEKILVVEDETIVAMDIAATLRRLAAIRSQRSYRRAKRPSRPRRFTSPISY